MNGTGRFVSCREGQHGVTGFVRTSQTVRVYVLAWRVSLKRYITRFHAAGAGRHEQNRMQPSEISSVYKGRVGNLNTTATEVIARLETEEWNEVSLIQGRIWV